MDTDVIKKVNGIIIDIRILEIYRRIVGVEANNCGNAIIFGNAPEIGMRETIQPKRKPEMLYSRIALQRAAVSQIR